MKAELPELELIKRDLEREVAGRKIKSAAAAGMSALPRYKNRKQFLSQLEGAKINAVIRQADYFLFPLDSDHILVIRLGSGMLRRQQTREAEAKGTEIVITFTQGGQLRLVDPEGTAEAAIVANEDIMVEFPELNDPAVDPIDTPLSWLSFRDLIESHPTTLKALLTDGKALVGIGGLYADEVLFDASTASRRRCRPRRSGASIDRWSRPSTTPSSTGAPRSRPDPGSMCSASRACSSSTSKSSNATASSAPGPVAPS